MKLRSSQYRLVLVGLPALTAAIATAIDVANYNDAVVREDNYIPSATLGQLSGLKPTSLAAIGTKDAPVDGNDGKPHAGPFVDRQKPEPSVVLVEDELVIPTLKASLKGAPEDITYHDGQKIPDTNDGVMDDAERAPPKVGTTGTEGGVSQKEKERLAHEGLTGEKLEKTPEPPKQAPPLPHSEEKLVKASTKGEGKATSDASDLEDIDGQKVNTALTELLWKNVSNRHLELR